VNISEYDLLNQCGGRSHILIDGHALLENLVEENYIDFRHGGQFLHLAERLEIFIRDLNNRRAKYHVVFFGEEISSIKTDCLEDNPNYFKFDVSYRPITPAMRTARRLLMTHLQFLKCKVAYFDTWLNNPKWDEFLLAINPAFLIGHRDSHLLMYHLHVFRRILFVTDIRFQANTIYGFCTAPEGSSICLIARREKNNLENTRRMEEIAFNECVQRYVEKALSGVKVPSHGELKSGKYDFAQLLSKCDIHPVFTADNNKIAICLYVCTVILQNCDNGLRRVELLQLSQLFIATQLLQTYLEREDRAQPVNERENDILLQFLNDFHQALDQVLWSTDFCLEPRLPVPELVDIVDGRLFYAVCRAYLQLLGAERPNLLLQNISLPESRVFAL
jgi:hypothetical protein